MKQHPRVLVVEDEPAIAELVAVNLRHGGFQPVCAGDAEEAQRELDAVLPDAILLDWMLPGQSGLALARNWSASERTRAIPILIQVCGALQEAHDLGIVHRDLKPENIFLSKQGDISDYPKVLDFGLAKVTERHMQPGSVILTQEGMVFGTPEFMSPEQAQGKTLDARSDIYSLAVILYEVLTGKLPFTARTPMEYIQKHVTDPIIPLSERVPDRKFAKGLDEVLAKALQKHPDNRYQTAGEFGEALRPFGGAAAKALPPVGPVTPAPGGDLKVPSQRSPAVAAAGGPSARLLVIVAAACLFAGVLIAIVVMKVLSP